MKTTTIINATTIIISSVNDLTEATYGGVNILAKVKKYISSGNNNFLVNRQSFFPPGDQESATIQIKLRAHPLLLKCNQQHYKIHNGLPVIFVSRNCMMLQEDLPEFQQYTSAIVFGKGPTFRNVKSESNVLRVAINQSATKIADCHMLSINDAHNIIHISPNLLKTLKYIILPEYLHVDHRFNIKGHWRYIYNLVKPWFTGRFIIFNLADTQYRNAHLFSISNTCSTGNTAIEFLAKYLSSYIKNIELYGIAVTPGYNGLFRGYGTYPLTKLIRFREDICKTGKIYNVNINFN